MLKKLLQRPYQITLDKLPDYYSINLRYFKWFHRLPNFQNPKTFNEKIAWRKLYQRDPRFAVFADKIAVKNEVSALIGQQHIIETLWTGERPDEIPYGALKPPYVIKVSHGSGGNIFIRTSEDIDRATISESLYGQLRNDHSHWAREWGYSLIPPRIIIERMIELPDGEVPEDYKFFVFHGRAHFIQLDCNRFKGHTRNLYDREWNLLPARFIYENAAETITKPDSLTQMLQIAERIGSGFDFARVDLYSTPKGIMFGEVTFYPEGGCGQFFPEEWDAKFGEPWQVKPNSEPANQGV